MKYKYTRKEAIELARNKGYGFKSLEKLLLAKQEDKKEYKGFSVKQLIDFAKDVNDRHLLDTTSPLDSIEEIKEIKGCFSEHTLSDKINSLIRNQTKIINYLKNKQ